MVLWETERESWVVIKIINTCGKTTIREKMTAQAPTKEEMDKFKDIFRMGMNIFEYLQTICYHTENCKEINPVWSNSAQDIYNLFDEREVDLKHVGVIFDRKHGWIRYFYNIPPAYAYADSIPELVDKLVEQRYKLLHSMLIAIDLEVSWGSLKPDDEEAQSVVKEFSSMVKSVMETEKYDLDYISEKLKKLHDVYRKKAEEYEWK